MGTNGAVVGSSDAGMRVTKGKCVRVREGLREATVENNEGLIRVSNNYIYRGFFVISR